MFSGFWISKRFVVTFILDSFIKWKSNSSANFMQNTSATGASTDFRQSIVVVVKQAMTLLFIFYAPTNLFDICNGPGLVFYFTGFLN